MAIYNSYMTHNYPISNLADLLLLIGSLTMEAKNEELLPLSTKQSHRQGRLLVS